MQDTYSGVVANGLCLLAILANFCNLVGLRLVDAVDQIVDDIDEDDLEPGLVKKLGNEAAADIATPKTKRKIKVGSISCQSAVKGKIELLRWERR
jgi:hypothetical protein